MTYEFNGSSLRETIRQAVLPASQISNHQQKAGLYVSTTKLDAPSMFWGTWKRVIKFENPISEPTSVWLNFKIVGNSAPSGFDVEIALNGKVIKRDMGPGRVRVDIPIGYQAFVDVRAKSHSFTQYVLVTQ